MMLRFLCMWSVYFLFADSSATWTATKHLQQPRIVLQTIAYDDRDVILREGDDPCSVIHEACCKDGDGAKGVPSSTHEDREDYEICVNFIYPQLTRLLTASWSRLSSRLNVHPSLFLECKEFDVKAFSHHDNVTMSLDGNVIPKTSTEQLLDILRRDDGDTIDQRAREFDERRNDLRMTSEEQVDLYRQAILIEPNHPLIVSQLGVALLALGREELARALFANAVSRGIWPNVMQRPVNYYVPALTAKPWHDPRKFAFTEILEQKQAYDDIREELLVAAEEIFYVETENRNSYNVGGNWKTLVVKENRDSYTELARTKFPRTIEWLEKCGEDFLLVKFSALDPGTVIHPHTGPSNDRLRSHFTLVHSGGAKLRVGEEWHEWVEGEVIVFDSSWEHEVVHEGPDRRIVLILDIWHPDYISTYSDGH